MGKRPRSGEGADGQEDKSAKRQKRVSASVGEWAAQSLNSLIAMNATWTKGQAELTRLSEDLANKTEELNSIKKTIKDIETDIEGEKITRGEKQEKKEADTKPHKLRKDAAVDAVTQMTTEVRTAESKVRRIERDIHEELKTVAIIQKQREQQEPDWEERKNQFWQTAKWGVKWGAVGATVGAVVFLGLAAANAAFSPEEVTEEAVTVLTDTAQEAVTVLTEKLTTDMYRHVGGLT